MPDANGLEGTSRKTIGPDLHAIHFDLPPPVRMAMTLTGKRIPMTLTGKRDADFGDDPWWREAGGAGASTA
jgi:hypothetical protein